jgi:hypothetical protein
MSEYQYYEFQAIDRPLTGQEIQHLRSYSTRAQITPTRFVNEYNWGNFKGEVDAWMERYFDAFLYFANWGTRILKLRLPARLLDPEIVRAYGHDNTAFFRQKNGNVILTFCCENEGGGDTCDLEGPGLLSSLISVRAELARGDRRALYLGWLVAIQSGGLDENAVEPPVPAGLGQLSGSLEALADFLRVDRDLLHIAAQTSPARAEPPLQRDEVAAWIAALPPAEKDEILTRLIVEPDNHALPAELLQRFLRARDADRPDMTSSPDLRRTVGALLDAAQERTAEREEAAVRKAAEEKARREREAAAARARHLDRLAGQEPRLWADIDRLVVTKLPKNYDQAMTHLLDLRDLAARDGSAGSADFASRLENFRVANARKPSLLERLARAGL